MLAFDHAVFQILLNCGCSQFALKFAGLTLEKLYLYTLQDIVGVLSSDVGEDFAEKIYQEIQRSKTQRDKQKEVDDELEILDVIVKEKAGQGVIKEEVIEDDEQERAGPSTRVTSRHVPSIKRPVELRHNLVWMDGHSYSDEETTSDDDQNPKITELNPYEPQLGFLMIDNDHDRNNVKLLDPHDPNHNCSTHSESQNLTLTEWTTNLAEVGSKIYSLEMSTWTWQTDTSLPCPYNLFKILSLHCPFLRELILTKNIHLYCTHPSSPRDQHPSSPTKPADQPEQDQNPSSPTKPTDQPEQDQIPSTPTKPTDQPEQQLKLPKLKVLRISHLGELDFPHQLQKLILASVYLRQLHYTFERLSAVTDFLTLLQNFRDNQLENLKLLSIKSNDFDDYLTQSQLILLSKIEAVSLTDLELGHGLWEDIEGSTVTEMLKNFPTLKKLTIHGCFKGTSEVKPNILIKIPPMLNLETVHIGGNYGYMSLSQDQSHPIGPPTKSRKGPQGKKVNSNSDQVKSFPVSIQFPLLMNLTSLELGTLYQMTSFHFTNFPDLQYFYVGSRWDLAVTFLTSNANSKSKSKSKSKSNLNRSYPLITGLQIPDCLEDPFLIKLIPIKFPNLKCCYICLPTVRILRTFFSVMSNSKLETLDLTTQFDFASTLDTCLLDHPSRVHRGQDELDKVELLKNYEFWEEYVKFHNIELPEEDLTSLEGEHMAGLSSLKNLRRVVFEHEGRILRIPKGKLHFSNSQCEFTNHFIGFWKYPWSVECEVMRSNLLKRNLKTDEYLRYDVPFRTPKKPENLIDILYEVQSTKNVPVKEEK